jgi:hypothetical protein
MFLTEKLHISNRQTVLVCRSSYIYGSGQLPGYLHPVDSRMLCLPRGKRGLGIDKFVIEFFAIFR